MKKIFVFLAAFGLHSGSATITVETTDGGNTATCQVAVVSEGPAVPEAVDLGLPSGIKWASCNLGASKPEEVGSESRKKTFVFLLLD